LPEQSLRIFISSTKSDLVPHREAVRDALEKAGYIPIDMDDFMARDERPVQVCLDEVERSDLLIGIYAWRYGYVPKGAKRSITEREYEHARKLKKPCFCFLLDESHPWPDELRQQEGAESLAAFKAKVCKQMVVCRFTDPDNLAICVLATLQRWKDEHRPAAEPPPPVAEPPRGAHPLQKLLDKVESRSAKALFDKTSPRELELAMQWTERDGGPLGSESPALQALPAGGLAELLHDHDRLLLSGPAGCGKTVALLELTRKLAVELQRRRDPSAPVPVPFSLASLGAEDRSLADWLVRELNDDFALPPKETRPWVESGALFPLLDGLDEAAPEDRPQALAAIAAYLESEGGCLVLSTRTAAYEELAGAPSLHTEILIEPLSLQEVESYLEAAGPGLEALRAALQSPGGLGELARTPLLLSLLVKTYQGAPADALASLRASNSLDRPRRLAEDYAARMEAAPGRSHDFSPPETRRALSWLARTMVARGITRFEIEKMEPTWLGGPAWRRLYALLSRGIGGLLLLIPATLFYHRLRFLAAGLAAGVLVGLFDALPVWRPPASGRARDALLQTAVRTCLITGAVLALFLGIARFDHWGRNVYLLLSGLALLFGFTFGTRPGGTREDIRVFERLAMGWSWKGGLAGAAITMPLTFLLGLLARFVETTGAGEVRRVAWLIVAAGGGLLGLALGGIGAGLEGSFLSVRRRPGLGLRRMLRHALHAGLLAAGATTAILGLFAALLEAVSRAETGASELGWIGLIAVPLLGLLAGLIFSLAVAGLDLIQHWTLRLLLSVSSPMPLRWKRFLDHAVDRGLLYRNDGAWEFPDRLLRDGFAAGE